MAMFCYNPKQKVGNFEPASNGWTACVEKGLLKISDSNIEKGEYIVDGFENKSGYKFDVNDIWYSFDPIRGNFHAMPDSSVEIKVESGENLSLSGWLQDKLNCVKQNIDKMGESGVCASQGKGAPADCTHNHKWIYKDTANFTYIMAFNRLWCDSDNHIHNNFGQVQFMRYPKEDEQINHVKTGKTSSKGKHIIFQMMYPSSGEDGEGRLDPDSGHIVYNVPFDITRDAGTIAKAFADFITLCEKADKENKDIAKLLPDFTKHCEELKCPTTLSEDSCAQPNPDLRSETGDKAK